MSTSPSKRAAAKRVPQPTKSLDPAPAIAPSTGKNDEVPGLISAAVADGTNPPNSLFIREDLAPALGVRVSSDGETKQVAAPTPGRIVLVTVEAYPSHIVTRPALVVSNSGDPFVSRINVHVFWDWFRDGRHLETWCPDLAYSPEEQVNTWRYPTRS